MVPVCTQHRSVCSDSDLPRAERPFHTWISAAGLQGHTRDSNFTCKHPQSVGERCGRRPGRNGYDEAEMVNGTAQSSAVTPRRSRAKRAALTPPSRENAVKNHRLTHRIKKHPQQQTVRNFLLVKCWVAPEQPQMCHPARHLLTARPAH